MLCSISIESRAATTNIGTGKVSTTVSASSFYFFDEGDLEYQEGEKYAYGRFPVGGTHFADVDFVYRLPIGVWNGDKSYAIPATADVLRFYSALSFSDATTYKCTATLGSSAGSGSADVQVQSVTLSIYGEEFSCANNLIDVLYPVKSRSASIGSSSVTIKVHGRLTVHYNQPYSPPSGSAGGYMLVSPKLTMSFGGSDYTMRIYDYAGKGVSDTDITDQTKAITDKITETNKKIEEGNKTTSNIFKSITDFFGSFFKNLINSVISLFVPTAAEMSGLFEQLNQFFSDRFGFLYAPFDYMIRLLGVFTSSTGSTGLTLPGFSIMGYEVWGDQTYDLASDPLVGKICEYVRTGTGILLAGYFIMYLQNFFKERFGSG